ncbi:MAG: acetyl-CoA decarbonylase/synthase complex subunit beta, partial [Candidatus Bathyarchaeota archaeon]
KGPIFEIEKGDMVDTEKGEFSGVNDTVKQKSLGEVTKVCLYTTFGYPHTSCGCFEGAAFYIPEVDGFGLVHRGFQGETVNGLPFSTIADSTAGGRQVDGFHGISIEYMRSPKFLKADGGWNRVVWLPGAVKERVKDFIPKEIVDKVATENDAKTIGELKTFLEERGHPIVATWKKPPTIEAPPTTVEAEAPLQAPAGMPVAAIPTLPITSGGYKIIFKNAKIYANKVIIRPIKGEKAGGREE